jgi:hypothetical protein
MRSTRSRLSAERKPGSGDDACMIQTLAMDAVQQTRSGHPLMPMPLPPLSDAPRRRSLRFDPPDPEDVVGRISPYRSTAERVGDVERPRAPLCHCGLGVDGGCSDLDRRRRSFRQWRLRQARDPRGSRRIARRTGGRSRQASLRLARGWHLSRAARQRAPRGLHGQVGFAGVLAGACSMPAAAAIAILPAGSTVSSGRGSWAGTRDCPSLRAMPRAWPRTGRRGWRRGWRRAPFPAAPSSRCSRKEGQSRHDRAKSK